MHSWNLKNIYTPQVKDPKIPLTYDQDIVSEGIKLYKKQSDNYILIEDIDEDYFNNILFKSIKLGSTNSIKLRNYISDIITKLNSNTPENLNLFQNYIIQGKFSLDTQKLTASESLINKCISENTGIMLDSFLKEIYGEVYVYNEYFKDTWISIPATTVTMGRAGSGELFLAFFCNGNKGKKGDLRVGDEDIEIKGYNGRLFKSNKIQKQKALDDLRLKEHNSETQILDSIACTIGLIAGTETYKHEIFNLISQLEFKSQIIKDYEYLNVKGYLPRLSLIMEVAGILQLFAYKIDQKFDSMIAFNDKLPNGLWLQFLNFKDINTIADLYDRLKDSPSKWRISSRTDGFGFSLQVSPKL